MVHSWATSDCVPGCEVYQTPQASRGYVAGPPKRGPLPTLSLALACLGHPKRRVLCTHAAHLWASFEFVTCQEAMGTPKPYGVFTHPALFWATSDFVRSYEALGTPQRGRSYVATLPTCGPCPILPLALNRS